MFSRFLKWWREVNISPTDRAAEEASLRQSRLEARRERERVECFRPCPYCNAPIRRYQVTNRSYRGRIAAANKEWACGTTTGLHMMQLGHVNRGHKCLEREQELNETQDVNLGSK